MLAAAYEYLRISRPFKGWKLPDGDEIEFCVTRHRDRSGDQSQHITQKHFIIRVSAYCIETTTDVMCVTAHEVVHMYQDIRKTPRRQMHNAEFKRLWKQVCAVHGFGEKEFLG